jgi:hypothetical protein
MGHVGPTLVDALTERKEQPTVIFPLSQPVVLKSLPFFYCLHLHYWKNGHLYRFITLNCTGY